MRSKLRLLLAGAAAGAVNGLFGAGGGMVLVPMLSASHAFSEKELFSSSIVIILPMCFVSLLIGTQGALPWQQALPFLIGAVPGGILSAVFKGRIPIAWLHRFLGLLILYGGVRYLC